MSKFNNIGTEREQWSVSITPEIENLLRTGAPCVLGISGGKDSSALAIRMSAYLDDIGFTCPRLLIHADLGRVEWKQSIEVCHRLASRLGWELMVVNRRAGDLMERWEKRWENNVERYRKLECVKLILPWSTPSMRFCTSELKTAVICSALKKRFPKQNILSLVGVRHDESASRAKMPVAQVQPKLSGKNITGFNWNPIIDWSTAEVYSFLESVNEPLHEAYTTYGATRVSCAFCIMASIQDLLAGVSCEDNHDLYRMMVDLECKSTFAFQGNRWLGDVAPHFLDANSLRKLIVAKNAASIRERAEKALPKHLLYSAGWPTTIPSVLEAELLVSVRKEVSKAVGIAIEYDAPEKIRGRYASLISLQSSRNLVLPACK